MAGFKMFNAKKMDVRESIEDFKDKPNVRGYYRCRVLIQVMEKGRYVDIHFMGEISYISKWQ